MTQQVSQKFNETLAAPKKQRDVNILVSWTRAIRPDAGFFTLDASTLGGGDYLKGSDDVSTLYDKYEYSDETDYVKNYSISRKTSEYGYGVVTARAKITLNNGSGRFTPENSGDIGDKIQAGLPIKILTGHNNEQITIFTGYCGQPTVNVTDNTVEIEAFDTMTFFNDKYLTTDYYRNLSTTDMLKNILTEQGFAESQYEIDGLQLTYPFFYAKNKSITSLFRQIARDEGALICADETGRVWAKALRETVRQKPPAWKFTYSNMTDADINNSPIINSVTVNSTYLTAPKQGAIIRQDGGEERKIDAGKTEEFFVEYDDDIKYALETGEVRITANTAKDGKGQSVALVVSGDNLYETYKITVKNTSSTAAYISGIELDGLYVRERKAPAVTVENIESIERYRRNPDSATGAPGETLEVDTSINGSDSQRRKLGDDILERYSRPLRQFTINSFMVPQLQLGDTVDVEIRDLRKTYTCAIVGIELSGGVRGSSNQKIYVQAIPEVKNFILSQSRLDSGRVLAS